MYNGGVFDDIAPANVYKHGFLKHMTDS